MRFLPILGHSMRARVANARCRPAGAAEVGRRKGGLLMWVAEEGRQGGVLAPPYAAGARAIPLLGVRTNGAEPYSRDMVVLRQH